MSWLVILLVLGMAPMGLAVSQARRDSGSSDAYAKRWFAIVAMCGLVCLATVAAVSWQSLFGEREPHFSVLLVLAALVGLTVLIAGPVLLAWLLFPPARWSQGRQTAAQICGVLLIVAPVGVWLGILILA